MTSDKYLVVRKLRTFTEVDDFDCYHSVEGEVGIPTEYVVELTREEVRALKYEYGGLVFIPIVEQKTIKTMLDEAKQKARERAKATKEREAKKAATAKKRKKTLASKRKEKELKQLEELKKKYDS